MSNNMFLNQKLVDLYLDITTGPLNYVCNNLDINYSHAIGVLNMWEAMGLIIKNKSGYRYNIFYTYKGQRLADFLTKTRVFLKRNSIQWVEDNDMEGS
jgi:predicted transcriptional regulator